MSAVDAMAAAGRAGIALRLGEDGKIKVTGAPEAVQRLLALLRAHRDELSALLRGDACRHCGRWLDWSRPDAVTFADSTAAHLACYEQAELRRTKPFARRAIHPTGDTPGPKPGQEQGLVA